MPADRQHGQFDEADGNFAERLGTRRVEVLNNYLSLLVTAVMHLG